MNEDNVGFLNFNTEDDNISPKLRLILTALPTFTLFEGEVVAVEGY